MSDKLYATESHTEGANGEEWYGPIGDEGFAPSPHHKAPHGATPPAPFFIRYTPSGRADFLINDGLVSVRFSMESSEVRRRIPLILEVLKMPL